MSEGNLYCEKTRKKQNISQCKNCNECQKFKIDLINGETIICGFGTNPSKRKGKRKRIWYPIETTDWKELAKDMMGK